MGRYAELRHSCENLLKKGHEKAQDIEAQRDYMDMVCRSYAARLEKRRNLLITSVRFHRLAEEVRYIKLKARLHREFACAFFCIIECRKRFHPSLVSMGDANAQCETGLYSFLARYDLEALQILTTWRRT